MPDRVLFGQLRGALNSLPNSQVDFAFGVGACPALFRCSGRRPCLPGLGQKFWFVLLMNPLVVAAGVPAWRRFKLGKQGRYDGLLSYLPITVIR